MVSPSAIPADTPALLTLPVTSDVPTVVSNTCMVCSGVGRKSVSCTRLQWLAHRIVIPLLTGND
jgi:hypothetical protein